MPYDVRCESCQFEADAPTVGDALRLETEHKRRCGESHRVTIVRCDRQ